MRIRQATLADAQDVARIHVAGWQAAYRGQIPDAVLDNLDLRKRAAFWQTHLTQQPSSILVAELNREIIGFCDLIPSRDKDSDPKTIAEIAAIYVHPNYWRQGTGRALCQHALETARRENFIAVTLWVLALNATAQNFYQAMGFHLDGATKSEPIGTYELHEVRFRAAL